ncbi:MAG: MBL fold metallo-hydrolase [Pseudomonadales bacterium]|nr:MBL fold metallo-hydrolase [Pseudomonadales bacterium]
MTYSPLPADLATAKPATEHTREHNKAVSRELPFEDRRSFDNAQRGFIGTLEPLTITRGGNHVTFDLSQFEFLQDQAPDTVNPSLWRQAQLNAHHHGLYEVCPGLYQVRSFDIANMTIIEGDTGWVIIDPLTSSESSAAALALANKHLGERPVTAVVHTHSHADHFAGVLGVITQEDANSGRIPVVAPLDFVEESLNENVLAGNVMNRRATYMYGNLLKPGAKGFVTTGLGAALSMGTTGFVIPNDIVEETGEIRVLDGIEFEFQMTMGTEAPAEFVFFLPKFKALCMSEITSHHLHNVYTPRGAQVRDALAWAAQIDESVQLFGDRLEIQFASHHWPIWGRENACEYMLKQRDLYKFIHDQTLRLANTGSNKEEIAERVKLPDSLGHEFSNRDYYGTVHHNSRAVYVKYLGYFDGNPATLYPLPPSEVGAKYVQFMGGADSVVEKADVSFQSGEYRWVAEVLNHVVMSDPEHIPARSLLADTYEQLGYQSESAPWRNFYLCGALELREGLPEGSVFKASEGIARGMPLENLFRLMAVRLIPDVVAEVNMSINFEMTDLDENWLLTIENAVLNAWPDRQAVQPTVAITGSSVDIKMMFLGLTSALDLIGSNKLVVTGDIASLAGMNEWFATFSRRFPIVTPRPIEG